MFAHMDLLQMHIRRTSAHTQKDEQKCDHMQKQNKCRERAKKRIFTKFAKFRLFKT